jgi:hypothetical protein
MVFATKNTKQAVAMQTRPQKIIMMASAFLFRI